MVVLLLLLLVVVVVPEEVSSEEVKKKFESRLIERFQLCCQVDHLFVLPIGEGLTNLQYYLENLTNDHPPTQPKKSPPAGCPPPPWPSPPPPPSPRAPFSWPAGTWPG